MFFLKGIWRFYACFPGGHVALLQRVREDPFLPRKRMTGLVHAFRFFWGGEGVQEAATLVLFQRSFKDRQRRLYDFWSNLGVLFDILVFVIKHAAWLVFGVADSRIAFQTGLSMR